MPKQELQAKALCYGSYKNILVMPKQLIFEREYDGERVIVAINADSSVYHADFNARAGMGQDLITGKITILAEEATCLHIHVLFGRQSVD